MPHHTEHIPTVSLPSSYSGPDDLAILRTVHLFESYVHTCSESWRHDRTRAQVLLTRDAVYIPYSTSTGPRGTRGQVVDIVCPSLRAWIPFFLYCTIFCTVQTVEPLLDLWHPPLSFSRSKVTTRFTIDDALLRAYTIWCTTTTCTALLGVMEYSVYFGFYRKYRHS